jgi:hypothetical protein
MPSNGERRSRDSLPPPGRGPWASPARRGYHGTSVEEQLRDRGHPAISRSRPSSPRKAGNLSHKSLQVRLKNQRPRAASMGSQCATVDSDIEQRPFYSTYASCFLKSKRDSVIIRIIRILTQPFADVLHNCRLMPTSITKSAVVPCCYRLG